MATPKVQERERIGTDGRAMNGTADRPFNGTATVALPPLPAAPMPGSPAWRAALKALKHYDPAYRYNPAYEYDDDYTTDPDYGVDGVDYLTTEQHKHSLHFFTYAVDLRRGQCARREFRVHLSDAVKQALGPDHEFHDKSHLMPDVAVLPDVFPPGEPLPHDCRLDVDPPPLLVLEVLSESTWRADLGPKWDTYAAMGIAEYWLYDPDGHASPAYSDRVSFWGWRLDETGTYVRIPRQVGKGEWPVYHSEVLGADIRMLPAAARDIDLHVPDVAGEQHRLQWWDPDRNLWRDPEVDGLAETERQVHEIQAEAEHQVQETQAEAERQVQEARLEERIAGMRSLLETKLSSTLLAQIEANWHRAGQTPTAAEVANVLLGQADWRSLQFPDRPDSQGNG